MNRSQIKTTTTFAVAALAAMGTVGLAPTTAHAQSGNTYRTASLPDSVRPVMQRASLMLQAARSRQSNAAYSSRQSYRASEMAFRQALMTGRFAVPTTGDTASADSNLPISSSQVAEDIRVLKSAMARATPAQASALKRVASLYATGAKEFFTGQLRDALFSDNTSGGAIVIRGNQNNGTGYASSALTATGATTGRTVTPRGAQRVGGVILPDGSLGPVTNPPAPAVPANGFGNVSVTDAPPVGITPPATTTTVNPLSPVAPVVVAPVAVPVVPAAPVAPVAPPPPANP